MSGLNLICLLALIAVSILTANAQTDHRQHPRLFKGTRWEIAFGKYEGVKKFAISELQKVVQVPFPYVVEVNPAKDVKPETHDHLILVGTAADNSLIKEAVQKGLVDKPQGKEGYSIACFDSPWKKGQKIIAIVGANENGVLYGVEEFNTQIAGYKPFAESFEKIENFKISDHPRITNRGIWTWGFVIGDYKRFFDNMARLKMNTLIVWNDDAPLNGRELVEYAHSRGVRVIFGFHWGWGIDNLDPNSTEQRKKIKKIVVDNYKKHYRDLGMDGIYFQTFTENSNLVVGKKTTAQLACEWVNDIAADILKLTPNLRIEFGLHATSIRDRYMDLKGLDPRVTITWEDAGSIPFAYDPVVPDPKNASSGDPYQSLQATIDYSKKIATFRSNKEFSIVAKGWITLHWEAFEFHDGFILGERDQEWIKDRLKAHQARWDYVNGLWEQNYPYAAKFYRELLSARATSISVTGLIEDGQFEEKIQPSVALFAQTLWNPFLSDEQLLLRSRGISLR